MGLLKKIVKAVTSAVPALLSGNIPGALAAAGMSFLNSEEVDDGLNSFTSTLPFFSQALSPGMATYGAWFNATPPSILR